MNWILKPKPPEDFIKQFPEYEPIILQLLYSRGLRDQKTIDEFFNPDYEEDLHDPFLMLGMEKAINRIFEAIKKQESIAIFGDYDADGVCGAVILKTVLEALGANLSGGVYIPDRKVEGYGLNIPAIKKISEQKVELILTVDCGSSDFEEIKLANSLSIETIIVDHHKAGDKLPKAHAVVNPCQKGDKYPFKGLAGAGVAFKLAQALISDKCLVASDKELPNGWEKWLLDLVAIATVADCVPLLGENRTLVRYGLIVLAQTQRPGLLELMKIARLNPIFEAETLKTNLDSYSLGFILGPRLNAAGRMHHASLAFELLMAKDQDEARVLAEKINQHNIERQKMTEEVVAEVEEKIKPLIADKDNFAIIVSDKNWSRGIIGLVAGKISERYHRPVIVLREEEKESRGSARSIPGFDIVDAVAQCSDLLLEFGGHPGSAGMALENKNLPAFTEKINKIAHKKLKETDLTPVLQIDAQINAENIVWGIFDRLKEFEPCSNYGNPRPTFLLKNLEIVNLRLVGSNSQHLKLELKSDKLENKIFKAIGFRLANGNGHIKAGDRVDLVFELIADEWNGSRELQLKIIDIKIANDAQV